MDEVRCPLCGENRTVSPNESFNCLNCETEITTDNDARISKVKVHPERLVSKLKSLTDKGKKAEAEMLLHTLTSRAMSDNDNRVRVTKARDMFAEWLSKHR